MSNDTKYETLDATLSAVGKKVFVEFYYDFKNAEMDEDELAQKIHTNNPKSKSEKQGFRIPRAKHIFEDNRQIDALKLILRSERVAAETKDKALHILQEEYKEKALKNDVMIDSYYRHFNGNIYRIVSIGINSESLEAMVVYQDVSDASKIWIRPLDNWIENIEFDGNEMKRFRRFSIE